MRVVTFSENLVSVTRFKGSTRFAIPAAHNSYWLLAAGYWLLVAGCWLLVTWFLAAGYRGLEAGIKTIGCWLLAVLGRWR